MKQFYTCKDVMDVMGVGESKAYKIIKCLNQELNSKGYITVSGKVSSKYFEERVYGIELNKVNILVRRSRQSGVARATNPDFESHRLLLILLVSDLNHILLA